MMTGMSRVAIKNANAFVAKAQDGLLKAIENSAKEIVRRYPIVRKYVHAMGRSTFEITLLGREDNINVMYVAADLSSFLRRFEEGELDDNVLAQIHSLADAISEVNSLLSTWGDLFAGVASGIPLKIGKTGKVVRDW